MPTKTFTLPSGAIVTLYPATDTPFDALNASDDAVREYGLPPRPTDPTLLAQWNRLLAEPVRLVEPSFRRREEVVYGPLIKGPVPGETNWSGAIAATAAPFTFASAAGKWNVPETTSSIPSGDTYASAWVGIDGAAGSHDVFQAGIEAVAANGEATRYSVWWEWFPEPSIAIDNFPIAPGHVVSCLLTAMSNKTGKIVLVNHNTSQALAFDVTAGPGIVLIGNTAEWIVERPTVNGEMATLADYRAVRFVEVAAARRVGLSGVVDPVILRETSPNSPSLASLDGRLFLSWRGVGNDQLSIAYSVDGGRTFGHKFVSTERSSDSPVLCSHNGELFIAWKGADNPALSVARVVIAGDIITGLSGKIILPETSPASPTLASLAGRLYLSWFGVGGNLLSIACSTDDGRSFGHKFVSTERSSDSPVLCAHSGNLFIAWKGVDNPSLTIAMAILSGDAITGLTQKVILPEISPDRPTLASRGGRLILSWRGVENNLLSVAHSSDNGRSFGHKFVSIERSSDSPALCAHEGRTVISWKGVDNPSLTVAVADEADDALQPVNLSSAFTVNMLQHNVTVSTGVIESATTLRCNYIGPTLPVIHDPVILQETSPVSPSLASLSGRMYLSWRGVGAGQLSIAYSADGGRTFGHKFVSDEKSSDAPVIGAHNGNLFIAWKGIDNPSLSVARVTIDGDRIAGLANKVILPDISPVSPTLASLNGRLFLSWRGVDNNQLSIEYSGDDGRTFGHKFISLEKSSDAPVLCAHHGKLFIAWKGVDNPSLTIAIVTMAGDTITGLAQKVILPETSETSPTLASLGDRLFLSWRGLENNLLSLAYSVDDGRSFGPKFISTERSSDAPALCAHDGATFLAWKGVDNTRLTVANIRA